MRQEIGMSRQKNLLFITTDQQRVDSLPCYGADFVIAPNLERLAAEGTVFESCYVSSPVCVPCRATMMTGQFPSAHGAMNNNTWISSKAAKWTDAANDAGYRTAAIGKMHFAPWDAMEGFQERIICEDKRQYYLPDDHSEYMKSRGVERPHPTEAPGYFETCGAPDFPYDNDLYEDSYIADRAAQWLENSTDDPFAVWVSFVGPHDPYDPPSEFSQLYSDAPIPEPISPPENPAAAPSYAAQKRSRTAIGNSMYRMDYTEATREQMMRWRRHYYGNITAIDEGIGRILSALEKKDLLDDTVIVFTSDHGDALGDHGMVFKGFFYESMVHVPLIVRDGASVGRSRSIVGTADVVAYFYDVLGLDPPDSVQGISLGSLLLDSGKELHDYVFSEMPTRRMVFDGRHKYIYNLNDEDELYDLVDDPDEMQNVVSNADMAPVITAMKERLLEHTSRSNLVHASDRGTDAYPLRKEIEARYKRELESGG